MNKPQKMNWLPLAVLGAGILGALLRLWLFATGLDSKDLLVSSHIAQVLLWILTVAVMVFLALCSSQLKQAAKYKFNFPASPVGAIGCAAAALGILIASVSSIFGGNDTMETATGILGLFSAAALSFLGFCRLKGRHPSILFHAVVCVHLMLYLVCLYRMWSSDPQIQDYCFSLLAVVCVMLASYYDAGFAANTGSRQMHTFFHLATVYFCLVSLPRCHDTLIHLALGVWMLTNLCDLTPMPRAFQKAE